MEEISGRRLRCIWVIRIEVASEWLRCPSLQSAKYFIGGRGVDVQRRFWGAEFNQRALPSEADESFAPYLESRQNLPLLIHCPTSLPEFVLSRARGSSGEDQHA